MPWHHVFALLTAVFLTLALIVGTRIGTFAALMVASLVTGLVAGMEPSAVVEAITAGFGKTLGHIGPVIAAGVMIGKLLEVTGAANALAHSLLRAVGRGRELWAMASAGAVVSIPVFCDSGFVIMHSIPRVLARIGRGNAVALSLALAAGMALSHHLVPRRRGPWRLLDC